MKTRQGLPLIVKRVTREYKDGSVHTRPRVSILTIPHRRLIFLVENEMHIVPVSLFNMLHAICLARPRVPPFGNFRKCYKSPARYAENFVLSRLARAATYGY